jgi:Uma2 family endonuclease
MVVMNPPFPWHGYVCSRVVLLIGGFIEANDLGYIICNDGGIITERDPDTVRGADVPFYSYKRVPKGTMPKRGYAPGKPDLVVEVRSSGDTWKEILEKVAEYLKVGVRTVCVFEPEKLTATIFRPGKEKLVLQADDLLTFPHILPRFSVKVGRFFE